MIRDGFCESVWQSELNNFLPGDSHLPVEADVVIVGGGITGLTAGLILQKAGKTCAVLEARNIGFGTTGGTSAHLNTLMDTPYYQIKGDFGKNEAQLVANLARNAIELMKRNVLEYGIDCDFKELPGYLFSQEDKEDIELDKILQGLKDVGIGATYTTAIPTPVPYQKAIKIPKQAQLHPTKYLQGIATEFEKRGGKLIHNCRVIDLVGRNRTLDVITGLGKIEAKAVIYATHIPPGVNVLHFQCAPYRSYVMALTLKDKNYPLGLIYDMKDPYHYYRTLELEGKQFLIAGGEDHKTAHQQNTEVCFAKLESYIRKYYEVDEVAYKWSSQYFEPADGLPYIGQLPGNPDNVFVATGFGGNGLIYGTASALIISDLIVRGKNEYKDLFNPKRIKPIAAFEKVMKEGIDVMNEFVGKRLSAAKIKEFADLAKGVGKLVKYENKSIALYKDDMGKLFALNPSCPHIKCIVDWNSAERSWDCPCHGSRFSFTGEVLTGPANNNLEVIDLGETEISD